MSDATAGTELASGPPVGETDLSPVGGARRERLAWLALPATAAEWLRFAGLAAQLGLVWLLASGFHIENSAFYNRLLPLIFAGFLVNHLLAPKYRLRFFAALSVTSIPLVFGLTGGAWLVGISLG